MYAVKVEVVRLNFEADSRIFEVLSNCVLKAKEQLGLFLVLGEYLGSIKSKLETEGVSLNHRSIRIFVSEVPGFRAPTWFLDRVEKLALRNGWPITVLVKSREKIKAERLKAEG